MSATLQTAPAAADPAGIITDPETIERIEADLMLTVYQARRLARRRLLGLEPPPPPNPRARALLRRATRAPGAVVP